MRLDWKGGEHIGLTPATVSGVIRHKHVISETYQMEVTSHTND